MKVVSLGLLFLGYSVTYYGVTQLKGGNWGYWDLVFPSRFDAAHLSIARDGLTTAFTSSSSTPKKKPVSAAISPLGNLLGL